MTPADLQAWQDRVFGTRYGTQVKAAKSLAVATHTYRSWLVGRKGIPPIAERLCRYVEQFGLLTDDGESTRADEAIHIDQGEPT